jgi:hypothetical protein
LTRAKVKYLNEGDEVDCTVVDLSSSVQFKVLTFCSSSTIKKNNTAIIKASSNGHAEVVKLLIDAGASINAMNKVRATPLRSGPSIVLPTYHIILSVS